jgi:hypothetical protein
MQSSLCSRNRELSWCEHEKLAEPIAVYESNMLARNSADYENIKKEHYVGKDLVIMNERLYKREDWNQP